MPLGKEQRTKSLDYRVNLLLLGVGRVMVKLGVGGRGVGLSDFWFPISDFRFLYPLIFRSSFRIPRTSLIFIFICRRMICFLGIHSWLCLALLNLIRRRKVAGLYVVASSHPTPRLFLSFFLSFCTCICSLFISPGSVRDEHNDVDNDMYLLTYVRSDVSTCISN